MLGGKCVEYRFLSWLFFLNFCITINCLYFDLCYRNWPESELGEC